jgi:HSP20 family protein
MIPWSERVPRSLEGVSREMENLIERFFGGEGGLLSQASQPSMNLAETEDSYEATFDLPGLKPEDVRVELREGNLVVSGERRSEHEQSGKKFHRVERSYGSFRRSIALPGAVDEERIDAEYHDGVLRISLPKSEQQKARQIHVRGT